MIIAVAVSLGCIVAIAAAAYMVRKKRKQHTREQVGPAALCCVATWDVVCAALAGGAVSPNFRCCAVLQHAVTVLQHEHAALRAEDGRAYGAEAQVAAEGGGRRCRCAHVRAGVSVHVRACVCVCLRLTVDPSESVNISSFVFTQASWAKV